MLFTPLVYHPSSQSFLHTFVYMEPSYKGPFCVINRCPRDKTTIDFYPHRTLIIFYTLDLYAFGSKYGINLLSRLNWSILIPKFDLIYLDIASTLPYAPSSTLLCSERQSHIQSI